MLVLVLVHIYCSFVSALRVLFLLPTVALLVAPHDVHASESSVLFPQTLVALAAENIADGACVKRFASETSLTYTLPITPPLMEGTGEGFQISIFGAGALLRSAPFLYA